MLVWMNLVHHLVQVDLVLGSLTGKQNRRMVGVGRDLRRVCGGV